MYSTFLFAAGSAMLCCDFDSMFWNACRGYGFVDHVGAPVGLILGVAVGPPGINRGPTTTTETESVPDKLVISIYLSLKHYFCSLAL